MKFQSQLADVSERLHCLCLVIRGGDSLLLKDGRHHLEPLAMQRDDLRKVGFEPEYTGPCSQFAVSELGKTFPC